MNVSLKISKDLSITMLFLFFLQITISIEEEEEEEEYIQNVEKNEHIDIFHKGILRILKSIFSDCVLPQGNGGAIFSQTPLNFIYDSVFVNNFSPNIGGAIYFEKSMSIQIERTSFTNNQAFKICGAIYASGTVLHIGYSNFSGNFAQKHSGNIYTECETDIKECSFSSSSGVTLTAGITTSSILQITSSIFSNLTALEKNAGIRITKNAIRSSITNCIFTHLHAPGGGKSIYCESLQESKNLIVEHCKFSDSEKQEIFGSMLLKDNKFNDSGSTFSRILLWYLIGFVPIAVFLSVLQMFIPLFRAKKRRR